MKFERNDTGKKKEKLTGEEYREGNLPGTDTYDDGLDEEGRLVQPGSTSTESGGSYMEDTGPISDGIHRQKAEETNLNVAEGESGDDAEGDEADRWLAENDPERKGGFDKAA